VSDGSGPRVGVDDPYAHVDRCDHLTSDGRCRLAVERPDVDRAFARERRAADYVCVAAEGADGAAAADRPAVASADWRDCPHFRATTEGRECRRCGLTERRDAHGDTRPLVEEHHLAYADTDGHEITVALCRWCHARVHESWGRIDDEVSPTAEALAAAEERRSQELDEAAFRTAAERAERNRSV
jgi:hypothetical protein